MESVESSMNDDTSEKDFDLREKIAEFHAERWNWVSHLLPGITVEEASGIVPFQAWGEWNIEGFRYYYRERHGSATLDVGKIRENGNSSQVVPESYYFASADVEEFRGGENWVETFLNLAEKLKKSKFLYEFPCLNVEFADPNDHRTAYTNFSQPDTIQGWGSSVREAFDDTKMISQYLVSKGWTEEEQMNIWKMKRIDPVPISRDHRIFLESPFGKVLEIPDSWRNSNGEIAFPKSLKISAEKILNADGNDFFEEKDR